MPSQILHISSPSTEMMFKPFIYDNPSTKLLASSSRFDDDHSISTGKPLLSPAASFNGGITPKTSSSGGGLTSWYQNRRQRSNSDNCLCACPDDTNGSDGGSNSGRQTIAQKVDHAAAETFLLTRLCLKLLSYLGVGYRCITRLLALGLCLPTNARLYSRFVDTS